MAVNTEIETVKITAPFLDVLLKILILIPVSGDGKKPPLMLPPPSDDSSGDRRDPDQYLEFGEDISVDTHWFEKHFNPDGEPRSW